MPAPTRRCLTSSYGGSDAGNYNFTDQASATASITPKALTIAGSTAADKTYDGNTTARVTAGTLAGFVGSETVSVAASSGNFDTKEAGTNKPVTAHHTLANGSNGGLAGNYQLTDERLVANIKPAPAANIKPDPAASSGNAYQVVLSAVQQSVLPPPTQSGISVGNPDRSSESNNTNSITNRAAANADTSAGSGSRLLPAFVKVVDFGMRLPEGLADNN